MPKNNQKMQLGSVLLVFVLPTAAGTAQGAPPTVSSPELGVIVGRRLTSGVSEFLGVRTALPAV